MLASLVLASTLLTAEGSSARGRGGFTIRPHHGEEVVAALRFEVSGGAKRPHGFLTYSAEDHDHARYPHVVVRTSQFTSVVIRDRTVFATAIGEFHDEPAQIEIRGEDRSPAPDFFHIEVKVDGHTVYHRHSELTLGDIEVKP